LLGLGFVGRAKDLLHVGAAQCWLAEISQFLGQYREAAAHSGQAASIFEKIQVLPSLSRLHRTSALRSEVVLGQREVRLADLTETYGRNRLKHLESSAARVIAEALVHAKGGGYWAEAESWLDKALEADARTGARRRTMSCTRSSTKGEATSPEPGSPSARPSRSSPSAGRMGG